jgi:hypothetical protein
MRTQILTLLAGAFLASGAHAATVSSADRLTVNLTSIASSSSASLAAFDGGLVARVRNPYDANILVTLDWVPASGPDLFGQTATALTDTFFGWTKAQADAFCGSSCTLRLFAGEDIFGAVGRLTANGAQLNVKQINRFEFTGEISPVPVPAALPLLLAGLGGLAFFGRRRKAA